MFQEMDMREEFSDLLNSLDKSVYGEFDYTYEFIAKRGSHNDGLCVFYNTEVYKAIFVKKDHYRGVNRDHLSNRCMLMILFEHIESGKLLIC